MFLDHHLGEFLCFMFRVASHEKFCVLLAPGDSTKLGGYFGFAVWGLSGYIGSWDSGHRLCMCWPVTKGSERLLCLSQSPKAGRGPLDQTSLHAQISGLSTHICFLQTRSRPLDTGRCPWTSTAVILQRAMCNPAFWFELFVYLYPQPNQD